jgi:dihydrofolate synthase/folylpolyglutamate synthase
MAWSNPSQVRIHQVERDGRFTFSYRTAEAAYENIHLALRGYHQVENATVAIETAECLRRCGYAISSQAIIEGLETVEWPGRLEILQPDLRPQTSDLRPSGNDECRMPQNDECRVLNDEQIRKSVHHSSFIVHRSGIVHRSSFPVVLLDGAHNPAGAKALRQYLVDFGCQPLTLIFGAMQDKRIEEMAEELLPLAQTVILTRVQEPRAADLERLGQIAAPHQNVILAETVSQAIEQALSVTPADGMICVTGSLYLVGAVKQWTMDDGRWTTDRGPSSVVYGRLR